MAIESGCVAEAVLNHALEIICLLAVEDFCVVRRVSEDQCVFSLQATGNNSNGHQSAAGCAELSFSLQKIEDKTQKVIVGLTNRILQLLTSEVPVKCEDVAVYFSMEEWEYLESHEKQYKQETNQLDLVQASSSRHFPVFADLPCPEVQAGFDEVQIKVEPGEEPCESSSDNCDAELGLPNADEDVKPKMSRRKSKTNPISIPTPCKVCNKMFSTKASLSRHIKTHTKRRPFSCNTCGNKFFRRSHLTAHKRIHSGERPFACKQCGQKFICQNHLVLHQVVHTRERPYTCPVCGKGFTRQSSVVKHSGLHAEKKPHVCQECGKDYCQLAALVVHQRLHSGERPFVCGHCNLGFRCKGTLLTHERSHTGERPYACPHCDKTFTDHAILYRHKRHVHDNKPQPSRSKKAKKI